MAGRFLISGWIDVDDDKVAYQTSQAQTQTNNMIDGVWLMEGFRGMQLTMTPPNSDPVTVNRSPNT